MRKKSSVAKWDILLMLILLALAAGAGSLQRNGSKNGVTDRVTSICRDIIAPVSRPTRALTLATFEFTNGLVHARELSAEVRILRSQSSVIAQYTESINLLRAEISNQRKLLKLQETSGRDRIPADVIGYSAVENRVQLNVGASKGVEKGMAVEAGSGLVGTIESVERDRSQVLLITSRTQIFVIDAAHPNWVGEMRGRDAASVDVVFRDQNAPIVEGDLIVTSGLGLHIPRGIHIGKVLRVEHDPDEGQTLAIVDPAIDLGSLREVFVLR